MHGEKTMTIPAELRSAAQDGVVTSAEGVFDYTKGKSQEAVNADIDTALDDRYTKSETYNKTELNNLITTPNQEYVTVADYASLPATGSADTIYRVSNYDGEQEQVDATRYSEYSWDGTQYILLSVKSAIGEVFDISAYHSGQTYADLAAALNGGANIPQSLQKGGMSVKFVRSSDNKYVQYRLMSDSFNTTVSNWQGVDDVPTFGSDNLVKSGGVSKWTKDKFAQSFPGSNVDLDIADDNQNILVRFKDGHVKTKNFDSSKVATTTSNGMMSAADKLKLDSLTTNIATEENKGYMSAEDKTKLNNINNPVESSVGSSSDLDICDYDGNILARFSNGHVKTKNFDSSINSVSAAEKNKLSNLTTENATQTQRGYMSAADKYKINHVEDIYHSYDEATPITSGLMSAADKSKLDNMIVQTPTISGSGMYKNAAAYGFLPSNDGAINADNLQSACDGGGTIVVDIPGVYEIKHKILLDSNTTMIFGANVFIKRVAPATPASGERWDYYSFINRGAYSKQWNENINIIGLHFLPNAVTFTGNPVQQMTTLEINGVCGHICFYYIKHLKVFDFDVQDSPEHDSQLYALHIQKFEDVVIENVNISYMKDGIHFSTGEGMTIRHCRLRTCDDSIAINACEYPDDVAELGWIKNVVIEDVVFVDGAVEDGWRFMQRYILLDVGAWGDWYEGMTVARHGSIVVSNGRIYRTIGDPFDGSQITYLTSRVRPTHLSGFQTYTDSQGTSITWYMAQDTNIVYNAGIENLVMKDIVIDRMCSYLIREDLEITPYSVQYQEGSDMMLLKNILLDNIRGSYSRMIELSTPFRNVKILRSHIKNTINCNYNYDISDDKKSTLFISECEFDEYSNNTLLINQGDRSMKIFCKNNFFIKDDSTIAVSGENIELITD